MRKDKSKSAGVRRGIHWPALIGVALLMALTLGAAAANLVAHRPPTARERQRAEQAATIAERRARIAMLQLEGDRCRPAVARELAKALIYDGRSVIAYAADFERRCGEDPIVRQWAAAEACLPRANAPTSADAR